MDWLQPLSMSGMILHVLIDGKLMSWTEREAASLSGGFTLNLKFE